MMSRPKTQPIRRRHILINVASKVLEKGIHLADQTVKTSRFLLKKGSQSIKKVVVNDLQEVRVAKAIEPARINPDEFDINEARPCDPSSGEICIGSDFGNVIPPDASERIILVIDGGGARGVIEIAFLAELEQHLKKNMIIENRLQEILDVISGSSVGGILATIIAKNDKSVTEIANTVFVNDIVQSIFSKKQNYILRQLLLRPKYFSESRAKVAKDLFGDMKVYDLPKKLIVPTVNISSGRLHFWTNIGKNPNPLVREILLAATAAPTYFPSEQIQSLNPTVEVESKDKLAFEVQDIIREENRGISIDDWHVDGGIGTNSPCTPSLIYARSLFPREKLRVISVGVGDNKINADPKGSQKAGGFWWITKGDIIQTMMNVNNRVNITQTKMSNPKDFLRVTVRDVDPSFKIDTIDDVLLDRMRGLGKIIFQENLESINKFFKINEIKQSETIPKPLSESKGSFRPPSLSSSSSRKINGKFLF